MFYFVFPLYQTSVCLSDKIFSFISCCIEKMFQYHETRICTFSICSLIKYITCLPVIYYNHILPVFLYLKSFERHLALGNGLFMSFANHMPVDYFATCVVISLVVLLVNDILH